MNYAVVYLGGILFFSMLYWFLRGRKFYTGPLIEADVTDNASSSHERSSSGEDLSLIHISEPTRPY